MNRTHGYAVDPGWRAALATLGLVPRDVLRHAGLPEDLFAQQNARISTAQFFSLWQTLESHVDDPRFPLMLAQASTTGFSVPMFAALCSPNLEVALTRLAKYKRLIAPVALALEPHPRGQTLTIRWLDTHLAPPRSLVASELGFFVTLARHATRVAVRPVEVRSAHRLEPQQAYEDFFGVRVTPGDAYQITFAALDMQRPFLTRNAQMWSVFEADLKKRLDELDASSTTADRVRAALLEALPAGQATVDLVCKRLGMSRRTLQRRLKTEQTSFQQVLQDVRQELALHYLERTDLPSSQIAFLLGFEETSSFFRAFQSWTGSTPETTRKTLVAG